MGLVPGLLSLALLSCGGGRTAFGKASSRAGTSVDDGTSIEPGTGARRPTSSDGTCPASYARCGSGTSATCMMVESDPMNCGACGHACASGIACVAGVCQQRRCTGPLTFEKLASYPPTYPPRDPADPFYGYYSGADVNQDGHLDLLEWVDSQSDPKPIVWLGKSDGTFEVSTDIPTDWLGYGAFWDFNEDGFADLPVFNQDDHSFSIRPVVRQPDLEFPWPEYGPTIADVNGDGRADIVNAGREGIAVYANACVP